MDKLHLPYVLLNSDTLRALQLTGVQDDSSLEVHDDFAERCRSFISYAVHHHDADSFDSFRRNVVEAMEVNIGRACTLWLS